jgi:hypothetical protein
VKYDFFQVTGKGTLESYTSVSNAAAWKEQNASKLLPPRTRQHVNYTFPYAIAAAASSNKKQKLGADTTSSHDDGKESQREMEEMLSVPPFPPSSSSSSSSSSYWVSGDARKLFAPKLVFGTDCDVWKVILDQIDKLERVNSIASDWREFVDGGDRDNLCLEHDVFLIQHRSMYLACALRKLLDKAATAARWTWQRCIEHAIKLMNDIGIETYSHWRPLARWHRQLAYSPNETFMKSPAPKCGLPPFFVENPNALNAFKAYGVSILKEVSVEKMHSYVLKTLIPLMMSKVEQGVQDIWESDDEDPAPQIEAPSVREDALSQYTKENLRSFGLSKVSIATVVRWMHTTGFRYKNRCKHYFVDGHEKPETLAYRPVFTRRYLSYEVQAYRWIQVSLVASKELEAQDPVAKKCGYQYVCPVNQTGMVEYHVDALPSNERIDNRKLALGPYGGNVSVRRDCNKPMVMFIGQDEAIFKQFSFHSKMWTGP